VSNILSIIVAAALVNNVVLVNFLGVSSLFLFTNRLQNAIELALLSFLVLFTSAVINLLLFTVVLEPLGLEFLKLLCFVGTSAGLTTWMALRIEEKFPRRQRLAFYLIGGNSAVVGVSLLNTVSVLSLGESLAYSLGAALGFALLLIGFAALRLRIDTADVPAPFRGAAIHLISAGIFSMCLLGFAGLV
jgi:electron transport complex protein RnfA